MNIITVTSRRSGDIDVFIGNDENILGYQLGQATLKSINVKDSPFPHIPPEGTVSSVNITTYMRVEYALDTISKDVTLIKYEADDSTIVSEVKGRLKKLEDKGICIAYDAQVPNAIDSCNNCQHKHDCV